MMELDRVTKEDFAAYESIRVSGILNMLDPKVQDLAGISRATHLAIIEHYRELCDKWPDVRTRIARLAKEDA